MSVYNIDVIVRDGLGVKECRVWVLRDGQKFTIDTFPGVSWKLLAPQSDLPWLRIGDFNDILFSHEKNGGDDRADWQMRNFRAVVDACGFHDVPFTRYKFTYDNGRAAEKNV